MHFSAFYDILQALDQVIANHGDVLVPVEAWEGIVLSLFVAVRSRWCGGVGDSPLGRCMNTLIHLADHHPRRLCRFAGPVYVASLQEDE